MNFREEIQNMLRLTEKMTPIESNRTIFAISTIGLLIGKENLLEISHNTVIDLEEFSRKAYSYIDNKQGKEVLSIALSFLPHKIETFMFVNVIEIITKFDLKHIVLDLGINSDSSVRNEVFSISSIEWINSLVSEIFKTHGGHSIYNCDCGTADFILHMFNNNHIEKARGMVISQQDYYVALIRKYFLNQDLEIVNTNTFFAPKLKDKVDMIYCSYPLIFKYEKEEVAQMIDSWNFRFEFNKKYSANLLWIINALQSIKDDGMVISFVPDGVLFNGIDEEARRYLVLNNYVDTIISLPIGILPSTAVKPSLIILKKIRNKKSIKMIDASKIYTEQRRYVCFSQEDIEEIIKLYLDDIHSDCVIDVPISEILANDSYLGMNRYLSDTIENPIKLENVTDTIFRGYQLSASELDRLSLNEGEESIYRIINISDIQAEGFVSDDLRKIKYDEKKKFEKYIVEDGDIIITAKNSTIKSAIYRGNKIYKDILSGNLIAIRVNKNIINPYYLKAFIDSKVGALALRSIQTGTSIITITVNGLKEMKISLLSEEDQEAIGEEYKINLENMIDLMEKYKIAARHSIQIFYEARKNK